MYEVFISILMNVISEILYGHKSYISWILRSEVHWASATCLWGRPCLSSAILKTESPHPPSIHMLRKARFAWLSYWVWLVDLLNSGILLRILRVLRVSGYFKSFPSNFSSPIWKDKYCLIILFNSVVTYCAKLYRKCQIK